MPAVDYSGRKVGSLLVLYRATGPKLKSGSVYWMCRCDCGNEIKVRSFELSRFLQGTGGNRTKQCRECGYAVSGAASASRFTHGLVESSEYGVWQNMKERCGNPNAAGYANYGGRGISVCNRWMEFTNFISDMGFKPRPDSSIDRIDNDGPYAPGNCRWSTPGEQSRNTRRNRLIEHNGTTKCLTDWAADLGMNYISLSHRLSKMPVSEALTVPKQREGVSVARMITYDGATRNIADWAIHIGISSKGLRYRLKKMSVHEALTRPKDGRFC
jgi:hypothetical protein